MSSNNKITSSNTRPSVSKSAGLIEWIKKITWPTRREALRLTILVLIISGTIGIILSIIDIGFAELLIFNRKLVVMAEITKTNRTAMVYPALLLWPRRPRKKNLDQRVETMGLHKCFEVVVPTEEEVESKTVEATVEKKMYAGYILVNDLDDQTWYNVNTPGVTGFISAEDEKDTRPKLFIIWLWSKHIFSRMNADSPKLELVQWRWFSENYCGPFAEFKGQLSMLMKIKVS